MKEPTIHTAVASLACHRGVALAEVDDQIARHAFRIGASHCREMLARFVENCGDPGSPERRAAAIMAISIRANWNPEWGKDPGPPSYETE